MINKILDGLCYHLMIRWPWPLHLPLWVSVRAHDHAYRDIWANGEPRP